MSALLALVLTATLTSVTSSTPNRPASKAPPRPIIVHITHPARPWRDIGIGAAAGWQFWQMTAGKSFPLSADHYYFP
jgi:hypothetical protein